VQLLSSKFTMRVDPARDEEERAHPTA